MIENKERIVISKAVDDLEKVSEVAILNDTENKLRMDLRGKLRKLDLDPVKNLWQKARVNWVKHGDENSSYFHGSSTLEWPAEESTGC